jgi:hypothetical protein
MKLVYESLEELFESLNEKYGSDKITYYRFFKDKGDNYKLMLSGDTFGVKDILRKNGFTWEPINYSWMSGLKSRKEWEEIAPKIFKEIEKAGYKVQIHGKLDKIAKDWLSFAIPGYEEAIYPEIPDGNEEKVIIKRWHHYAPMTGVTGKGSRKIKDLLKYCGYNWTGWLWERIYLSEEVNDMIEYLKQNNYTIDDQRRVNESILNEEIDASEAYYDKDVIRNLLNGRKNVGILSMRFNPDLLKIALENNLGLIKVNQTHHNVNMHIVYRKTLRGIKNAKRLHEIMKSHGGYVSDKTPQEAYEIGKLLDYSDESIMEFIKRIYHVDKI